jgi:hypothetical protein
LPVAIFKASFALFSHLKLFLTFEYLANFTVQKFNKKKFKNCIKINISKFKTNKILQYKKITHAVSPGSFDSRALG